MMIGPVQSCSPYTLLDEEPAGPGPALGNVRFFLKIKFSPYPAAASGASADLQQMGHGQPLSHKSGRNLGVQLQDSVGG